MLSALALLVACYVVPVNAPVAEPFIAPACSFCPGHRGLGYATAPGAPVSAVAPGSVAFVGVVVGVRYVTVDGDDGLVVTYGMLATAIVQRGQSVAAGEPIGTSTITFMLSVRRNGAYIDPGPLVGHDTRRPRLVPADGHAARPARAGPPACAANLPSESRPRSR